jgi:hypothetical protein
MRKHYLASLVVCGIIGLAGEAGAQTAAWGNTGYVSFNGLYQSTPITFTTTSTLDNVYQESGEVRTGHRIARGPVYDVTAGGKVKGRLGVSTAVSYRTQTELGQVSASVPHPMYYNQGRLVAGEAGLKRKDLALHVAAMWPVRVSDAIQVSLFGGPTYFRVGQDMVNRVETNEVYPFDQAEYAGFTASNEHASHFGYNAGADVSVFFTRSLGVGALVRFSQGTVDLPSPNGGSSSLKVGGLQTGAGVRLRF